MNRFSAILYTMLAALVVCLTLFLAPYVHISLAGRSFPTAAPPSTNSVWTFQDRVDFALWKLRLRKDPPAIYEFEQLIELITQTVHPQSWDEVGGTGSEVQGLPKGREGMQLKFEQRHVLREGRCEVENITP